MATKNTKTATLARALVKSEEFISFRSFTHAFITSDESYIAENAETVNSVEAALKAASDDDNVFIIGGGRVYAETFSLADRLYITEINGECADADVFFPAFDKEKYERIAINKFESEGTEFSHILYKLK